MSKITLKRKAFHFRSGFTMVELLVVIAIVATLSIVAYLGIQKANLRGMNEKVESDLVAIENALNEFKKDKGHYPAWEEMVLSKDKNVLCFDSSMTYVHLCEKSAFLQTQVDNDLLTKRYLQEVPVDPRTGSRYSYGVSADGQYFQVAGILSDKNGNWSAKVRGNLDETSPLPSLIRAYDAPNFVMEGGNFLPYSSNPNKITARLHGLQGSVNVNGASATEGQVMEAGDKVKTGANASVILYLSDGSITYLDPNSELQLLPISEVSENSKDNIITKVKLKLFSGSVWNKVVRLAEKSEFNVETTTAIAGVRGTEFGVDANTNKLVVYSGTVASRLKTNDEKNQSNGEGKFLDFSVTDAFTPNQDASGDTSAFNRYTIPAQGQAMGNPTPLPVNEAETYLQKYYQDQQGLTASTRPYLVKAKAHANGTYTLYVAFNGAKSEDNFKIDGFNLYGESQTAGIRTLKDSMQPLTKVEGVKYDAAEKAYAFELSSYSKKPGDALYNQAEDRMESILLQAYQMVKGKPTVSQLSWPPIGLQPDPKEEYAYGFATSDVYEDLEGQNGLSEPIEITEPKELSVALNEGVVALKANADCNWTLGNPTSGVIKNGNNTASAEYYPLDPDLSSEEKGINVNQRFNGVATEKVTITCADPQDANNSDSVELSVNYGPKSVSDVYQYSFASKAGTSWSEAKAACEGLKEGGLDWSLPSKSIYDKIDLASEKMNLCEWDENAKKCGDLVGIAGFMIQDNKPHVLYLEQGKILSVAEAFFQSIGYRCVSSL